MQDQMIPPSPVRWGGTRSLIFRVPYTDIEILAIIEDDRIRGVIYLPHKLAKPIPWLSTCPHCRRGKQKGFPMKVRRAIQTLCSIRSERPDAYLFTLPNHCQLYTRRNAKGWVMRARKPRSTTTLWVKKLTGEDESFEGPIRDFRSPMLLRTLRFFFSAREPNEREIQACLRPLRDQGTRGRSQKPPCQTFTWMQSGPPQFPVSPT